MYGLASLILYKDRVSGEKASKADKHSPRIEAPDKVRANEEFSVAVKVGPHPSMSEHSIRWIDIYFSEDDRPYNPIHIARITLEPGYSVPEVSIKLSIKKSGYIHALAYCNLHGLWESVKRVIVE